MRAVMKYKTTRIPPILRHVLQERGWERVGIEDPEYDLFWKNGRFTRLEMKNKNARYNHFPNTDWITRKGHLQNILKTSYLYFGGCYDFAPRSWVFTKHSQNMLLKYEAEREKKLGPENPTYWIGKPSNSSRGRGIMVTKDLNGFLDVFNEKQQFHKMDVAEALAKQNGKDEKDEKEEEEKKVEDKFDALLTPEQKKQMEEEQKAGFLIVVQEYITNPMLIANYKFDLRLYVLVKSFHPLEAYLYNDGLVRFCTRPYTLNDLDPLRHLTNSSIQQQVVNYNLITPEEEDMFNNAINNELGPGDFSKRTLRALLAYWYRNGVDYQVIWKRIVDVINLTLLSLLPSLNQSTSSCFELLGFDILLTNDGMPKLVEVNMGPSLSVTCPVDQMIKQPLMEDMIDVIYGPQGPRKQPPYLPILPPTEYNSKKSVGDFTLIFPFSEESEKEAKMISLGMDTSARVKAIVEELVATNNKTIKE